MTLIEWRDDFRIGIESVDYEHRQLIDLINELYRSLSEDADKDDISAFLGEVDAKIAAHFALEEREMRDLGYRGYAEHKADHERLLDQIRDVAEAYDANAYADYSDLLAKHLEAWFTEHFRTKDAQLHQFLRNLPS
ncbi:MAG: bacteriohemerythrin [Alphaproteobacteria bacterium]|nr:bacteriohemerythrin [Alphaproteobacteria bacterium]